MRKWLRLLLLAMLVLPVKAMAADSVSRLFNDMTHMGFDERTAHRLYGRWSEVKPYLAQIAKSGSDEQVQLAAKLVAGRVEALDRVAIDTAKQMAEKGIHQPLSARFASGSMPPPPTSSGALRDYIVKAAAKDIDTTYVGRNLGVAEDYVERLAINWTARTTGRPPILPDKTIDYARVNQILKSSEFTPFPHSVQGQTSHGFQQKFPQIVHESYTGASGQRLIEMKYGSRATADIIRYGDDGLPKSVLRNQPVANVIAHSDYGRMTAYQRMKLLGQQYETKFMQHLEGNVAKRAETTSKMLAEMIENEARIVGYSTKGNALYEKAVAIKQALRDKDTAMLRKLTGNDNITQGLADFNVDSGDVMAKMYQKNRLRMGEFTDDALGRPATQSSRLATLGRAAQIIGYGVTGTDAYLRAKEGEKAKEVAKALTTALAADAAGAAAGSLAATTGGALVSGVGAAAVAAVVVSGGLDYTEEGIENLMGGYKTDATLKKIFLTPETVERFRTMDSAEIRKIIEKEWDEQHQWGGLYVGKGTDDRRREGQMKLEIYRKALEAQRTLNANALRTQIVGELVREQLQELVEKHDAGKLSDADLKRLSGILTGGDTGETSLSKAWREVFGEGFNELIEKRLNDKYKSLKTVLDGMDTPERPGLVGWMQGIKPSEAARDKAEARYDELRDHKQEIDKVAGDYDRHLQALRDAVRSGASDEEIAGLYKQLANDFKDLQAEYDTFASGMAVAVNDINSSYGLEDNPQRGDEMKSVLARLLQEIDGKMRGVEAQHSYLKRFNDLLEKAEKEVGKETGAAFDPNSAFEVLAVATDTDEVRHDGKAYQRVRSVAGTVVIVRQLGSEFMLEGQAAIDALVKKGLLRQLASVGYVTNRAFDLLVDYHSQDAEEKPRCDPSTIPACKWYQNCRKKYGEAFLAEVKRKMDAKTPLSKLSANEYWARLCFGWRDECQQVCSGKKKALDDLYGTRKDWQKDIFDKRVPMSKKDLEMFGGALLPKKK